jgi:hypothetical protein
VIPGGSSTPILTADEVENVTLDVESMVRAGSMMGSGGIIVIAEGTCMVRLLQVLSRFYAHESCGQCTPCREGTDWMNRILERILAGKGTCRRSRDAARDPGGNHGQHRVRARRCGVDAGAELHQEVRRRVRVLRRARSLDVRRPAGRVMGIEAPR